MRMPSQPTYKRFVERFLRMLFAPDDRVVLARLLDPPAADAKPGWVNHSLPLDAAIRTVLDYRDTPNVYFRASAHDGSASYGEHNCTLTRALYLDLDYGRAGHRKPGPFDAVDDALGYLLSMPLRPTCAWHTGHGLQALYLLDRPYVFDRHDEAAKLARYKAVSSRLSTMAMSDSTFTAEHAFRLPLSVNDKRWLDPTLQPLRGELLWCAEDRTYTFEQLENLVAGYGIDQHVAKEQEDDALPDAEWNDEPDEQPGQAQGHLKYEDLPVAVRQDIERHHAERSDTMFRIVGQLIRLGCSDKRVHDALRHGPDFRKKYEHRLDAEVDRCITKVRQGRYVYASSMAPPLRTYNEPLDVPLRDCPRLPQAMHNMLDTYAAALAVQLPANVRDAARFHEHLFSSHPTGVLESPCGSGKSTWAFCHIAVNAGPADRFIYVSETVAALYRAACTLEKLTDTPVGRVHGFNDQQCHGLCGQRHGWRQCYPKDPQSVCHQCRQRRDCAFYRRPAEQQKPILCMTHAGLIRAIEDDDPLLEDTSVVVDEQLNVFNTWQVWVSALQHMQAHLNAPLPELAKLFPYSSLACGAEFAMWGLDVDADRFARRNYVFRDEQQTADVGTVYEDMRSCLGTGTHTPDPFRARSGDEQRARETLADLLNFFRPSQAEDATYAYHEVKDDRGLRLVVKRNRFSLDLPRRYRRLWMLNASAQLCPYPYPQNMTVYSCPDIADGSHLLTLHVVRGQPTKTQEEHNVELSAAALLYGVRSSAHQHVMVATDKQSDVLGAALDQLRARHGPDVQITHLTRGRIKGENVAGDCTLAYVTSMATFTTVDDCALHAALLVRRTYPDRPLVYTWEGSPNWPGGRMLVPAMRQYYALRSLDELYQTIWRTAVRNNRPAEAVVAVPDPEWLTALWRTVMPRFELGLAYRVHEEPGVLQVDQMPKLYEFAFVDDPQISQLALIGCPPGTEFSKKQIAQELGYSGNQAWKANKRRIMRVLGPFFEDGSTNRKLRRRPFRGIRLLTHWQQDKNRVLHCEYTDDDFKAMLKVINDAAQAYKGVIPADRWHEPYMPADELREAIEQGVEFWGCEVDGELAGVMGMQNVDNVTLVRHAYVLTHYRRQGIGSRLLRYLLTLSRLPCLVGTWAAARWAISFYEKHGFRLVSQAEKDRLLRKYWNIPERQVETSVVLADSRWFADGRGKHTDTRAGT